MTFSERLRVWFLNLRYFVPALLVFLSAAFLQHPATILLLLLADALLLAGLARAAGFRHGTSFAGSAVHRGLPYLLLLIAYAALVALLIAYPLQWLERDRSLGATLAVSTEAVVAVLCLWRDWPAFGLLFVWKNARPVDAGFGASLGRSVRLAHQITGNNELFFSHGLIVALSLLILVVGAASIGAGNIFDSRELRIAAGASSRA